MQTILTLTTEDQFKRTTIAIDNSSDKFKDFNISTSWFKDQKLEDTARLENIQIDPSERSLRINDIVLKGVEVDLFLEFVNQLK